MIKNIVSIVVIVGLLVQFPMTMARTMSDKPTVLGEARTSQETASASESKQSVDPSAVLPCHREISDQAPIIDDHNLCDNFCQCSGGCATSCGFANTAVSLQDREYQLKPANSYLLSSFSSIAGYFPYLIYHPPKHS